MLPHAKERPMDLFKTFGKAILWGAGFGLGLTAALFVTRSFWMNTGPDYRLDQQHLAAIDVTRQEVLVKDGKLVVSGTLLNRNSEPIHQLSISSVVTEHERPIERCSTYTTYGKLIKPREEFDFVMFCGGQWSAVAQDALAAHTQIDGAFQEFSIPRR
jgi:hypothetical protein